MASIDERLAEAIAQRLAAPNNAEFVRARAREIHFRRKLEERAFSTKQREDLVKKGLAMPGGRYPIKDAASLEDATRSIGRGNPDDSGAIKAHIIACAKKLGLTDKLPPGWSS